MIIIKPSGDIPWHTGPNYHGQDEDNRWIDAENR